MKTKQPKPSPKFNKKLTTTIFIVGVLILLSAAAYATYRDHHEAYLDRQEKQRFETVRKSVKTLHQRLQQAAGPGVEWEMDSFCGKGSVKFQEAKKTCYITTKTSSLKIDSTEQARSLISKYSSIFKEDAKIFIRQDSKDAPSPENFFSNTLSTNSSEGSKYKEITTEMPCGSLYEIGNNFQGKANPDKRSLEISFTCYEEARKLHYPEQTLEEIIQQSNN